MRLWHSEKIKIKATITDILVVRRKLLTQRFRDLFRNFPNSLGIYATDEALFSDTEYMRRLLYAYGVKTSADKTAFTSWEALPDIALLSIKHHYENGKPFWHWVVFKRTPAAETVLDSAAYLDNNEITDCSAIKPKWYISVSI